MGGNPALPLLLCSIENDESYSFSCMSNQKALTLIKKKKKKKKENVIIIHFDHHGYYGHQEYFHFGDNRHAVAYMIVRHCHQNDFTLIIMVTIVIVVTRMYTSGDNWHAVADKVKSFW